MANELLQTINRVLSGVEAERAAKTNEALTLLQMKQRADEAEANRLYDAYKMLEQRKENLSNALANAEANASKFGIDANKKLGELKYNTTDSNKLKGIIMSKHSEKISGLQSLIAENRNDMDAIRSRLSNVIGLTADKQGELLDVDAEYKKAITAGTPPWQKKFEHEKDLATLKQLREVLKSGDDTIKYSEGEKISELNRKVNDLQNFVSSIPKDLEDIPRKVPSVLTTLNRDNLGAWEKSATEAIATYISKDVGGMVSGINLKDDRLKEIAERHKKAGPEDKDAVAKELIDELLMKSDEDIMNIDYPGTGSKESTKDQWLSKMLTALATAKRLKEELAKEQLELARQKSNMINNIKSKESIEAPAFLLDALNLK